MKKYLTLIFYVTLICLFGVPLMILYGTGSPDAEKRIEGQTVRVLDKQTGKINQLPIEEYLIGVVAAEMPAAFEREALKAQAVAARTYTVKRMFVYGAKPNPEHPEAEVCTDPTHCQAWISTEEQKEKWGQLKYHIHSERIKSAVKLTKDLAIIYDKAFIDPVYHGSCGGKGTENSEDVWSAEIPYLRGVDCDLEYKAGEQYTSVQINMSKLAGKLSDIPALPVTSKGQADFFVPVKKSPRGRLQEIEIYGKKVTGTELRNILGLGSTFIKWEVAGDKVNFTSTGKGHAVGMCQYGANGLALAGKSYREIIFHYYTGVKIIKLKY